MDVSKNSYSLHSYCDMSLQMFFPKVVGFSPKSSILMGVSIIFTIQFWGNNFWKHPYILPETGIASENGWLEDWFPFGFRPIFMGYASFTEGKILSPKRKPIKKSID